MVKENYKEVIIVTHCPFCGRYNEVGVNEIDYLDWDWSHGIKAQDAFPYLSANEREMIISGICPVCWFNTFGSEDETVEWGEENE